MKRRDKPFETIVLTDSISHMQSRDVSLPTKRTLKGLHPIIFTVYLPDIGIIF